MIETGLGWITRVRSNPSSSIHPFQKGRALAVLACRIEEVGEDPRESELIVAEQSRLVRYLTGSFAIQGRWSKARSVRFSTAIDTTCQATTSEAQ